MKKYLFDKIKIEDGNVRFYPFRDAGFIEGFMSQVGNHYVPVSQWKFIPLSFNMFLKMLSKTRLNYDGEYEITAFRSYSFNEEKLTFEDLLKRFAEIMCNESAQNEKKIKEFYEKAYKIKNGAQKINNLLKTDPSELCK